MTTDTTEQKNGRRRRTAGREIRLELGEEYELIDTASDGCERTLNLRNNILIPYRIMRGGVVASIKSNQGAELLESVRWSSNCEHLLLQKPGTEFDDI